MPEPTEPEEPSERAARPGGIPDAPAADPTFAALAADDGTERPLAALPESAFWATLYGRRSIRKFKPDPVPRELVEQVMHAGIWAPSSCNYQMWDLVAVDDPALNARLGALSAQMANAPVNIVVSYGRDFSEEAFANVQSASALIQNMSLAAHALGLGTFWITQTGDAEKVREAVGLPYDRMVVAVLALGWPKVVPKRGPKRRPLHQVSHWNHYAGRAIPSSTEPSDWAPDLLAIYQRARVLNGLRHNKPRAWEVRALDGALAALVPDGAKGAAAPGAAPASELQGDLSREPLGDRPSPPPNGPPSEPRRWLDVLPCTGIVTARLALARPGFRFDVVERTREVADFVADRVQPRATAYGWPDPTPELPPPPDGAFDVVSCIHRLEGLTEPQRAELLAGMRRWVKPGGRVLLAFVSSRSFHGWTESLRARRGGPRGVEYVLSPDPNVGPFRALDPEGLEALAARAGFEVAGRHAAQASPEPDEVEFRARNFSPRSRRLLGVAAAGLRWAGKLPGAGARRARFRYLLLRRPA